VGERGLSRLARRVRRATGADLVVLTLGAGGALLLDGAGGCYRAPARPSSSQSDVGAGDTFASAFGLGLAAGAAPHEAVDLAQDAAAATVARRFTAVVDPRDLLEGDADRPWLEGDHLARTMAVLERERQAGRRIVFTNGVFDLIHPGHVDFLCQARQLGDVLVVGINDDASVRRLKGKGRPVLSAQERAALVLALDCVDHALLFSTETASALVRRIRPHLYVKGGDYEEADLPEAEDARAVGAEIRILPRLLPFSTTELIRRVRQVPAAPIALAR
jgi:D-beta-D-heptose 7-phosphate kinase/D-beta-D-heptose 1-phosphate adenosyltransferase